DRERSDGDDGAGVAGPFTLRLSGERSRPAFARRGDEFPQGFAARVRPASGQAKLPMFGQPVRPPPALPPTPADSSSDPLSPSAPAPPGHSFATLPPPPDPASGNRGPHPIARLHGSQASGLAAVDRSGERPRLAGPHQEGDRIMEETTT